LKLLECFAPPLAPLLTSGLALISTVQPCSFPWLHLGNEFLPGQHSVMEGDWLGVQKPVFKLCPGDCSLQQIAVSLAASLSLSFFFLIK
jgi:hypothetical protein